MSTSPAELAQIDAVLRLIDREIWILTAVAGECRGGLIATWVSSASIDRERPVLLAGIAPNHFTAELVQASGAFAGHLLRPDQIDLAWNFARDSGRSRDKLAGLEISSGPTGSPILSDCLAWCDCRVFARYDTGDRLFFWADVVAAGERIPPLGGDVSTTESRATAGPLREQKFFGGLTDGQRQVLIAARQADVTVQRKGHEQWRGTNPW